jgi:protein-arginine kinase activator protein McsA
LLEIDQNSEASSPDISADNSDISDFRKLSMEELNSLLEDAVKEEDYDLAMDIQEEIKRRNKKID